MSEENRPQTPAPSADTPSAAQPHASVSFSSTLMRGDRMLWGLYLVLLVISVVEMFSASSTLTLRASSVSDPVFHHIRYLLVGMVLIVLFQNASRVAIRQWGRLIYFGGVILLLLLPFSPAIKEAHRSIIGLQPVEFAKLGTMMVLCELVTASDVDFQRFNAFFRSKTQLRRYLLSLVLVGAVCIPIGLQNLSSALIIALASLAVMFLAEVKGKYLLKTIGWIALAGGVALAALFWLHTVNTSRLRHGEPKPDLGFLNRAHTWEGRIFGDSEDLPLWKQDVDGDNSQEIYAHMALANSYPLGRMVGNSRLRDFLPEAFSDYIFAIIFEEIGFIGASFVLLVYLLLLWRGFVLSRRTENPYIRMLMIALPLIMVIQALMHIGVCTGAMFVTGQPLPLISRGGSSIIFTSISFGLMFALSRIIENEAAQKIQAS